MNPLQNNGLLLPEKAGVPHLSGDRLFRYVFILRGERWKGYLCVTFLLSLILLLLKLTLFGSGLEFEFL